MAIISIINMKSVENLMKLNTEQLKTYIIMSYLFKFLILIIVISLFLIYEGFYFYIISHNDEIYLKSHNIKYVLSYFVFTDNAYYFYFGFLKELDYRINKIEDSFGIFIIGCLIYYIIDFFKFINKISIIGNWENTSMDYAIGYIFYIIIIFSPFIIANAELAEEASKKDNDIRVNINKILNKKNLLKNSQFQFLWKIKKKYYFKWKIVYAKYI